VEEGACVYLLEFGRWCRGLQARGILLRVGGCLWYCICSECSSVQGNGAMDCYMLGLEDSFDSRWMYGVVVMAATRRGGLFDVVAQGYVISVHRMVEFFFGAASGLYAE
jgi:hypothetical protein